SNLAAGLGIGYTFAGFINPQGAAPALRHYRENFQPQGFGLESPRSILAVNVTVGETGDEGRHLVGSAKGYYARLRRAGREAGSVMVPTPDEAAVEMSQAERDEPVSITGGRWPRFVAGGPEEVRATLEQMLAESQADELMIQDLIADPAVRRRSREMLAVAFGLTAAE
ncbi:MAG: LLM class flavin-dependent oxidoreductase, partial [Corynebacterium sp.]|nr:LLM class flavin-dependent oxidoreductase [Corynebacterium sp.]